MKMTNIRKCVSTIAFLSPFAAVTAAPYAWEFGGSYLTGDTDLDNIELNEDNVSLEGTYYFEPLEPSSRSYRETAFLQYASWVRLGVDIEELDDDISDAVDSDSYELEAQYTHDDTGWFANVGYVNADADVDMGELPDPTLPELAAEYDGYSLKLGKYVARATTLHLGYTELDYSGSLFSGREASSDTVGLGFRHFGQLTENVAYSFEANYYFLDLQVAEFDELDDNAFDDSGDIYSMTATVYPNERLGLGLSYANSDDLQGAPYLTSTSSVEDGLGVFADYFVTENVSLRAMYNNSEYTLNDPDNLDDPGEVSSNTVLFGINVRL